MNIVITSNSNDDYLLIESTGSIETKEGLIKHARVIYEEIVKHEFKKVLVVLSRTHLLSELIPYFDLVKSYVDDYPPEIYEFKIAIVVAQEYKEIAESWESLCVSRGLEYHAFTLFRDAENWLLYSDDE